MHSSVLFVLLLNACAMHKFPLLLKLNLQCDRLGGAIGKRLEKSVESGFEN